ncbi:flavin reductase family protein [Streptococcus sp. CSL10205-OR2]|uniref:flavin reductase family protein n=1 Tax=Streptococcus sp. CSL10205-OR2 TaxID=2980558 RepID=UPI0021D7EF16|nr:flavin reductase family protein [Streptococcus sp. CSL10205-OR2]MCU9532948.1 flavin reductase family protein [Streptococcus sp. CSL10205-OR2]
MISIAKEALSDKEQYKILIGSVIPRPIAFVSTVSKNGVVNLAPFSFYNIVSHRPAILSVSIQQVNGQMKDTARNILEQKEAVIHSVSLDNLSMVNQAAIQLPYEESELEATGMTLAPSIAIKTPGVNEAKTRFETILYDHIEIKNEANEIISDLMLLKVLHYHLDEAVYQNTYVIPENLQPMSRLAGITYAQLGKFTELKRP